MRTLILLATVASLSAGCAARLPTHDVEPAAAPTARHDSYMTRVSAQRLSRAIIPVAEYEAAAESLQDEEPEGGEHELAVFIGYTAERGEEGGTIGFDYSYWITERVGVGPFVDWVAGDLQALAFGAGVWVRPFRRLEHLSFFVGPGLDVAQNHDEEHAEVHGEERKKWEVDFLLRLGVMYAFPVGKGWRLIPSFYWDVISTRANAYVMGLTIGKEF